VKIVEETVSQIYLLSAVEVQKVQSHCERRIVRHLCPQKCEEQVKSNGQKSQKRLAKEESNNVESEASIYKKILKQKKITKQTVPQMKDSNP
jgi:hypothetical protein